MSMRRDQQTGTYGWALAASLGASNERVDRVALRNGSRGIDTRRTCMIYVRSADDSRRRAAGPRQVAFVEGDDG